MRTPDNLGDSAVPESRKSGALAVTGARGERETTAVPGQRGRRSGRLDAGPFAADVASFRLHLAAENKAAGTIRIYTEAPPWFAAVHLLRETDKSRWEQVDAQDVQRWVTWLLGGYSEAYARQQYRALRQFFLWLAAEDACGELAARLAGTLAREGTGMPSGARIAQAVSRALDRVALAHRALPVGAYVGSSSWCLN